VRVDKILNSRDPKVSTFDAEKKRGKRFLSKRGGEKENFFRKTGQGGEGRGKHEAMLQGGGKERARENLR